jgi:(S)-sulfolactate dehydrogenase
MLARIVISEFMTQSAVDDLARDFEVVYERDLFERPADLKTLIADADGLIVRNRTQVRADLLDAARKLRVIGRLGVGLDNLDMEACAARGIPVFPATGANDASVAEYVIGSALYLVRRVFTATSSVLEGKWLRETYFGEEIAGRRLGLVGFGSTARVVAVKAAALDLEISAHDPYVEASDPAFAGVTRETELLTLLSKADIVSLHVPFSPSTRNLIDRDALAAMKHGAILINAARGGIVDEEALAAALKAGRLAGAALDVLATEPPSLASVAKFKGLDNLILTPHVAGPTVQSDVRVSGVTAANVRRVLEAAAG